MTQMSVSSADLVLHEIEAQAENGFLPIIGPQKGRYLAEEVRKAKPMHVLEVGTLIGYSAVLMGKEMQAGSEIVTIEIHRDEAEQAGTKRSQSRHTSQSQNHNRQRLGCYSDVAGTV